MSALNDQWRKSTRSGGNGACVEARCAGGTAQVRDSKDTAGPVLAFGPDAWLAFVGGVQAGRLAR